jgi:hypothetical protein
MRTIILLFIILVTYQISCANAAEAVLGIKVTIISKSDYDKILQSEMKKDNAQIIRPRKIKAGHTETFLAGFHGLNDGQPVDREIFNEYADVYDTDYLFDTLDRNRDDYLSMAELSHIRLLN